MYTVKDQSSCCFLPFRQYVFNNYKQKASLWIVGSGYYSKERYAAFLAISVKIRNAASQTLLLSEYSGGMNGIEIPIVLG
jgi:hypothetical protein